VAQVVYFIYNAETTRVPVYQNQQSPIPLLFPKTSVNHTDIEEHGISKKSYDPTLAALLVSDGKRTQIGPQVISSQTTAQHSETKIKLYITNRT
jgi:hypothetical protein